MKRMKRIPMCVAAVAALTFWQVSMAQEADNSAKDAGRSLISKPVEGKDKVTDNKIRIQLEYIELPTSKMLDLLYGDKVMGDVALRTKLQEMLKNGEAQLVDAQVISTLDGKEARMKSVEEFSYPTEYEPAELPSSVRCGTGLPVVNPSEEAIAGLSIPPTPTAFETRDIGSTVVVNPSLNEDTGSILIKLAPKIVYHLGFESYLDWKGKKSEMQIKMPIFYSLRFRTSVVVKPSKYCLVAALSPKNDKGFSDFKRKVCVFVKADLIPVK